MASLYDGDGGMEQRAFIKNAQVGWENVKRDTQRHLLMGVTQFEYLSDLGAQLTGEARQIPRQVGLRESQLGGGGQA